MRLCQLHAWAEGTTGPPRVEGHLGNLLHKPALDKWDVKQLSQMNIQLMGSWGNKWQLNSVPYGHNVCQIRTQPRHWQMNHQSLLDLSAIRMTQNLEIECQLSLVEESSKREHTKLSFCAHKLTVLVGTPIVHFTTLDWMASTARIPKPSNTDLFRHSLVKSSIWYGVRLWLWPEFDKNR